MVDNQEGQESNPRLISILELDDESLADWLNLNNSRGQPANQQHQNGRVEGNDAMPPVVRMMPIWPVPDKPIAQKLATAQLDTDPSKAISDSTQLTLEDDDMTAPEYRCLFETNENFSNEAVFSSKVSTDAGKTENIGKNEKQENSSSIDLADICRFRKIISSSNLSGAFLPFEFYKDLAIARFSEY